MNANVKSNNDGFYDGTKLLSMKDINGNKPEVYIVTTNRSGGKTTYYNRLAFRRWLRNHEKFCLVYRYNYELDSIAEKFFKDIQKLWFSAYRMRSESRAKGVYHELFVGGMDDDDAEMQSCGYAISLNNADQIKRYSHMMSDTALMIFDEFQSETNHYCPDEIRKFISVHTSLARGNGEQARYLPVIMISNPVSMINPYFVELGISARLDDKTRFLRGDGYVLEQGYVDSAAEALSESGFMKAFSENKYVAYSTEALYLNDSLAFIEKPEGESKYLGTLKYEGKEYGLRQYAETGILYCDNRPDKTFKTKIAVTTDDHDVNYVMLKQHSLFLQQLRWFFERGCFRFRDLKCKEVLMTAISY